ncbi:MAG: DUF3828 domain-containing protein [Bacteroidales bacterium]|jgi:hypothetical protein|nr:DUF3828 domain-containing protein [Bacteroidales bacterium]
MKKGTITTSVVWASTAILFGCGQQKTTPTTATESNEIASPVTESANTSVSTEDSLTYVEEPIEVDSTTILNPQVAQEIEQFISATYTEVFAAYTQANKHGGEVNMSVFDEKFISERLRTELYNNETIDCDYWLHAQDFTTPVFEIKGVHVTDEKNGYADIIIKVFGEKHSCSSLCRTIVQKIDGNWKIDQFQTSRN